MTPVFLTLDEVLEIYRDQIARYGGSAGIRDLLRTAQGQADKAVIAAFFPQHALPPTP